jgi:TonB family protein
MMKHAVRTPLVACLVLLAGSIDTASARQVGGGRGARPDQTPVPQGQRIDARDGDTIVVEDNARVRIVRRRRGVVRTIYNAPAHWLVVLVDEAPARGGAPDGRVDISYTFNGIVGDWPLPERWDGDAQVEDYFVPEPGPGRHGAGFLMPQGLLQFLRPEDARLFRDPAAAMVFSYRSSGSGGGGVSFDEAERQQVAMAARNAEAQSHLPPGAGMGIAAGIVGGGGTSGQYSTATPGDAPLRVGGDIAPPRKIVDAPVIYPAAAQEARIQGVVILEIVVGTDGSVTDARVLRSIPQLDEAAIETVRKWRYEPVLLNGKPVPIILTVTVNFTLQDR